MVGGQETSELMAELASVKAALDFKEKEVDIGIAQNIYDIAKISYPLFPC